MRLLLRDGKIVATNPPGAEMPLVPATDGRLFFAAIVGWNERLGSFFIRDRFGMDVLRLWQVMAIDALHVADSDNVRSKILVMFDPVRSPSAANAFVAAWNHQADYLAYPKEFRTPAECRQIVQLLNENMERLIADPGTLVGMPGEVPGEVPVDYAKPGSLRSEFPRIAGVAREVFETPRQRM